MVAFAMSTGERVSLTDGEVLLLDRRRRGETQSQAAERYGVSYALYGDWEYDRAGCEHVPHIKLGRIQPHERALIYRRRTGETQVSVAQALGVCAYTLRKMERGLAPCEDLLAYWEA